ncbi:hypothetical protein VNI00_011964 [Paramarasmius palmivorus]|uniref:C2H2-type domain-containing protein n=1 Tax=Paramarasmius palmivorus TaxID=297713 RepID=A0AAW0C954_9AGAR
MPHSRQRTTQPRTLRCPVQGCKKLFCNPAGVSNHMRIHGYNNDLCSSSDKEQEQAHSDAERADVPSDRESQATLFGDLSLNDTLTPPIAEQVQNTHSCPEGSKASVNRKFHEELNGICPHFFGFVQIG